MSLPLVSIVTPSFNQGQFLEETMVSVLEQDYRNLEYIVVDGGSTDGSLEIIRRYEDRLAWWTVREDVSQAAALNVGFARARGELLGWLSSDDALLPGAVSAAVEALESDSGALLVYGDNVFVDERSVAVAALPAREFDPAAMVRACDNHVPQPGSLFRRRALEIAPLNEDGYYFFDLEFVLRLSAAGSVLRVPRALANYRVHPASKSVGAPLRKARDYVRVADEFLATDRLPEALAPYAREGRATAYRHAALYFYEGLDLARARRYALRALRMELGRATWTALPLLLKSLVPRRLVRWLRARRRGRA